MKVTELQEKENFQEDISQSEVPASNLNGATEEDKQFFDASFAKFHKIMGWQEGQTLQTWTENLLQNLVPYIKGLQGILYYAERGNKKLAFSAGYALDVLDKVKKEYLFGEGLIGQVAENQEVMILSEGKEFVSLSSTNQIRLKCIVIAPLVYNGSTIGVMEINFPQVPQEQYLQFLRQLSESIASNLNALIKETELAISLKKIRQSEERLQRLAEVTTEGIAFLNSELKIVECNSAFTQIFGYNEQEIKEKSFTDLLGIPSEKIENYRKGVSRDIPIETLGMRKDATTFDIELIERDMIAHDVYVHIVSVRDITKRKEAEKNLRDKEAELKEAQKIVELTEIIRKKNNNITASINYAKRIQDAFLPEAPLLSDLFPDSFILFKPRDIVSGDFYWFTREGEKLIVSAVDCTGHGVPGAIMSMAGIVYLKQIVHLQKIVSPDEIFTHLHLNISKALKQNENRNRDGMDGAICVFDPNEKTVEFAGAKNSLIYITDNAAYEINGDKMPVGGFWTERETNRMFKLHRINLDHPTCFYMFTDGYVDQFGGNEGRKYMKQRLETLLLEIYKKPMPEQKIILEKEMETWMKGHNQVDDMLVVGFRIS